MARATSRDEIKPLCVTRVGPSRAAVSAPLWKSKRSLAKLVPTWISTEAISAARKGSARKWPARMATAVPTNTGAMAAGKVAGRAASSQARAWLLAGGAEVVMILNPSPNPLPAGKEARILLYGVEGGCGGAAAERI